jgi:adenine-specific DNA-methyltransferase
MSGLANRHPFLTEEEAIEFVREHICAEIGTSVLTGLETRGLLPFFMVDKKSYLLEDLKALAPLLQAIGRKESFAHTTESLFDEDIPQRVGFFGRTLLPLGEIDSAGGDPAISPALRNLSQLPSGPGSLVEHDLRAIPWLSGTFVRSTELNVIREAEAQRQRRDKVAEVGTADFAQTAYYMGTKRELGPFLVEALAGKLPSDGVVLDLMCGSGAASGAFSRVWTTYASDAQSFCEYLAEIQGSGFTEKQATSCLVSILETARSHEAELRKPLRDLLRREAELCHSDLTTSLADKFRRYIRDVPLFPGSVRSHEWSPSEEIELRQSNKDAYPWCLFTAYFATVFFSLRQATEIDSIRYAIDQLEDPKERRWALGALIVAVSVKATTYAAHFAQPYIRDLEAISLNKLAGILDLWSGSIYHEFAVRFERLSRQSELSTNPVTIIEGPWQNALKNMSSLVLGRPVAVYVDAPYTREEYSRYYHVLETLIHYDYPSAIGSGRIRSKAKGESFASEFFTRKQASIEALFVEIITSIIQKGWICAWSYSNTGAANIAKVIQGVSDAKCCRVECLTASHRHKSQRGKPHKEVTENLIIFNPS